MLRSAAAPNPKSLRTMTEATTQTHIIPANIGLAENGTPPPVLAIASYSARDITLVLGLGLPTLKIRVK